MTAAAALIAAAGVGAGHAVLPDHWVPLAVLGRTEHLPVRRVARLSALAGAAHVAVSLVLGTVIVLVGLQLRSTVAGVQDDVVGGLLLATGLAFAAVELTGHGHRHAHGEHSHVHVHRRRRLLAIAVPFGAAASPDLTILPVFLAAATAGAPTAVGTLLVFAAVTMATMLALTLFATLGGYQLRGRWLERWGNAGSAGVLLVIGALVLARVI